MKILRVGDILENELVVHPKNHVLNILINQENQENLESLENLGNQKNQENQENLTGDK